MKLYTTGTIIRASVFAVSLAVIPSTITAYAQSNSNFNSSTAQPTRVVEQQDDTDFGWLGLLGLAGLAGLLKKPQQVTVDRATDSTARANR